MPGCCGTLCWEGREYGESHQFGGAWTEEKLDRVSKYLAAYTTIFSRIREPRPCRRSMLMPLLGQAIARLPVSTLNRSPSL